MGNKSSKKTLNTAQLYAALEIIDRALAILDQKYRVDLWIIDFNIGLIIRNVTPYQILGYDIYYKFNTDLMPSDPIMIRIVSCNEYGKTWLLKQSIIDQLWSWRNHFIDQLEMGF